MIVRFLPREKLVKPTDNNIYQTIDKYYSGKIHEHGPNHKGVDWNSEASQELRFKQFIPLFDNNNFSINDYGCGYGSLYKYLLNHGYLIEYHGFDVSEEMIKNAKNFIPDGGTPTLFVGNAPKVKMDYSVASGIFNVRENIGDAVWWDYIIETINSMNDHSNRGFAFNCLTSYSDKEYMKENLFYCDPCKIFDYCKTHISNEVALMHDYGLYEFTVIVRKAK